MMLAMTEKVRRKSLPLILDEAKAHPDVMHMFLPLVLMMVVYQMVKVGVKDAIIIMTSNAGTGKAEACRFWCC